MKRRFPLYERLLSLYPADYRRTYGPQMLQTLEDMVDDHPTAFGRMLVWVRVALDLSVSVVKIQAQYTGAALMNGTPRYVFGSSLLSVLLLLPFFGALAANVLAHVFAHHDLYSSWLWHMPVLAIWVLWLPTVAFIIAAGSYSAYALAPSRGGLLRRALDIRRIWPVLVPAIIAFGILFVVFFHDSVHCWIQNPVYFVTRFHQTYECTQTGSSFGG